MTMPANPRWFWVGSREPVRARLAATFGRAESRDPLSTAGASDVVVVDARAGSSECAALPMGHVFAGVRGLKETPGLVVYVVVDEGDRIGAELARFCLADGVLSWNAGTATVDAAAVLAGELASTQRGSRPSVDELLQRVQAEMRSSGREDSTLQRLLQFERDDSLLNRLQDPETGLFDGPYATLKLDEEWKRAMRFHQPLSLLLVDLGPGIARLPDAERRTLLAEAAGVFLNECRDIDVLARFQPTVFLFLLPGTGPHGAEVLGRRMLASLAGRLAGTPGLSLAGGLCSVPAREVRDRKAFLGVAEACLRRAQASGAGGLCTTWQ
jgi:GGDEF domain-containing protein